MHFLSPYKPIWNIHPIEAVDLRLVQRESDRTTVLQSTQSLP